MTTLPLAGVTSAICELVSAIAIHLILAELSFVHLVAITGPIGANTMLDAVKEAALVSGAIGPRLDATSRLFVLVPITLVCAAILMYVLAMAMGSVLIPLTFIKVTIHSGEAAMALSSSISECAIVA
jgi:hypothetical protein